jgi:poly(3-hydroxybutyrate) depolymerase
VKKCCLTIIGVVLLGVLAVGLVAGCGDTATEETTTTTVAGQATTTTTVASTETTAVTSAGTTTKVVGYPENIYGLFKTMGGDRFDLDKWKATAAAEKIIASHRNEFTNIEMLPADVEYWAALGVKKEVHDADDEELKWYSYTPVQALAAGETAAYPVVFCFASDGSGFPHLGAEEGFITVRPTNPAVPRDGKPPAEGLTPGRQVVRILDALEAGGYPIDRSRVYATGMSIGGMASAWAGLEFPEVVAAVAMHSSLAAFNTDPNGMGDVALVIPADQYTKAMDYDVPAWLAVGDLDMDQLPIRTEGVITGLNLWLQVNNCPTRVTLADSLAAAASTTDPAVKSIGVVGDKTWTQTIDGVVYHAVDYFRADDVKMVEIVGVENQPHWVSAAYPQMAWDFMSKFSKDAEGKLIVAD